MSRARAPIGYATHRSGKHHPIYARTGIGKITPAGRQYISGKIRKLQHEGYPQQQAIAISYSSARRAGYHVPPPPGLIEHHSPTLLSKHVVDIANGRAKPRTVEEAKAAIAYMDELSKQRKAKELVAKKALLAFERGTGTTAGIKRAFKELPQTSRLAKVEVERRARRKIGLAIQQGRGYLRGFLHE